MKTHRAFAVLAFLLAGAAAAPAATRSSDDALSLVPSDAASVAVIRFSELRSTPLASKLFSDADHMNANGEAARFMSEANLKPREDVDTVVIVGLSPLGATSTNVLAMFEGRFDPDRLASAAQTRGASRVSGSSGDYWLTPENQTSGRHNGRGAVAFVSPKLLVAGSEPAVQAALAARAGGGTTFSSGLGLGRQLSRIDRGSSVWALVDVTRYPAIQKGLGRSGGEQGGSEAAMALMGAMKSVTLFSFQAAVHADDLSVTASGVSPDAETRQLLEDSLKGVVAMWRLAVQEKSPELVSVLRRFKIDSDGDAVTVSGILPSSVLRSLAEKRSARK